MRNNTVISGNAIASQLPKVLLVEDNLTAQMIFQFQLSRLNMIVTTVDTGKKALQALEKASYDMMILDVGLPDIPGDKILAFIREQEKINQSTNQLPVIIMTAHGDKEKLHLYITEGANAALNKPISFEKFKYAMQNIFDR